MTAIEQVTEQKPKPQRKRKAKKRAAPKVQKPSEMAGITPSDCPSACTAERCAISLRGICSHPYKGGLQANLQTPDTLRRLNEAKRHLGKAKLDLTTS